MVAAEYGWAVDQIIDLTVARLRALLDAIRLRQKNKYRAEIVQPFEWMTKWVVQSNLAGSGAGEKDIRKSVEAVKYPWEDDSEQVSDAEILAAGGDPDNEFWFIETGDLAATKKNAGKSIDNFKLSN